MIIKLEWWAHISLVTEKIPIRGIASDRRWWSWVELVLIWNSTTTLKNPNSGNSFDQENSF